MRRHLALALLSGLLCHGALDAPARGATLTHASQVSTHTSIVNQSMDLHVGPGGVPAVTYNNAGTAYPFTYDGASRQWLQGASTSGGSQFMATAVDASGHIHLAYGINPGGNYTAWYTKFDGASWSTPVAAYTQTGGSQSIAIAVDAAGNPTIAMGILTNSVPIRGDYRWAHNDGTGWSNGLIDSTVSSLLQVDVEVDASDTPHFAYTWNNNSTPQVRYRAGTGGSIQTVQTGASYYDTHDLALDASGTPTVLYEVQGGSLIAESQVTGAWDGSGSNTLIGNPTDAQLVIDAFGEMHLGVSNPAGGGTFGAFYNYTSGGAWQTTQQISTGSSADIAIALRGNAPLLLYSQAGGAEAGVWVASSFDLNELSVPEPATSLLLIFGLGVGFAAMRSGKRRRGATRS